MNPQERHLRPGRWVWAASMSVVVYSAFMLIPYGYAGFSGTGLFFAYIASLPVAACVLFTVGVWGGVGLLRSRVRERPLKPRHRAYVLVSCIGLASFALALGV